MIVRLTDDVAVNVEHVVGLHRAPATDATPGGLVHPAQPAKPEHTVVMLTHGPLLHVPLPYTEVLGTLSEAMNR